MLQIVPAKHQNATNNLHTSNTVYLTRRLTMLTSISSRLTALLALTYLTPAAAHPALSPRGKPSPPKFIPQNATFGDLRWQPALDFDQDGCYNVPAISATGDIAQGLYNRVQGLSSHCHDASDLDNNNVYSRQRCNNGWCAYFYEYYFEKDVAVPWFVFDVGHRHDWEHIVVWVQNYTTAKYVAASRHGKFDVRPASKVHWDGSHPKMVYHKELLGTHTFRFAKSEDDKVENHKGTWFRGPLVSYNGFPPGVRDKLFAHTFGHGTIAFKDEWFASNLKNAMPNGIKFDPGKDVRSPGTPGLCNPAEQEVAAKLVTLCKCSSTRGMCWT